MCLAIPGKIIYIKDNTATVDISGIKKDIMLDLISGAGVGDYVLIHAGYAIEKVKESDAEATLDFFKGIIRS